MLRDCNREKAAVDTEITPEIMKYSGKRGTWWYKVFNVSKVEIEA